MANNPSDPQRPPRFLASLPRPQKIAVSALSLVAILIVFFWAWQFRANLNRPFKVGTVPESDSVYVDPRQQDTDGDGLSDYDELNIFKTSTYLEDTDSDGLSDKQETDQGSDPNCPSGRDCNAANTVAAPQTDSGSPDITSPANLNSSGTPEFILQNALSGQIDAAGLRQLLLNAGGDQATLDQISDEELMAIYQESLQNQNTPTP